MLPIDGMVIQVLACLWIIYKGLERLILWHKDRNDKSEKQARDEIAERVAKIEHEMVELRMDVQKKISHEDIKEINEKLYDIHGQLSSLASALEKR